MEAQLIIEIIKDSAIALVLFYIVREQNKFILEQRNVAVKLIDKLIEKINSKK